MPYSRSMLIRVSRGLVVSLLMGVPSLALADAKSDYESKWGGREKSAKTPADRAKLAADMYKSVNGMISKPAKGEAGENDTIFDPKKDLSSVHGQKKEDALFLCGKVYEIGAKQQEGYSSAARALYIIQTLEPEKRIDCLTKLRKMYEDVYLASTSKNVGYAKGFAEVNLELGQEQYYQLQGERANGKVTPAQYVTTMKTVSANYSRGIDVVRSAMAAIRPYAKGKKQFQDFLDSAGDVEKKLLLAQKSMATPLSAAMELDRALKSAASFQSRLTANPADSGAADRLVRLQINELDDPAAIETVIEKASPQVKEVVSLMKKPIKELTAAQAFAVAQWCDKSNDNPNSPNRIAMAVRTRVYCEAYPKAAGAKDADAKQIVGTLKKVNQDLAKANIDDEKLRSMTVAYVAALEPAPVVAIAQPEVRAPAEVPAETPVEKPLDPPAEKPVTPEPVETPVKPVAPAEPVRATPPPAPKRTLATIKVETTPEPEVPRQTNSTIFDFGAD